MRVAELPGRTNPTLTADVRPQVNGILLSRLFTEGSDVKKGQVLYQIDAAPYKATLDQARATLANAQANLTTQKLQAERYGDLIKMKAVSQQDTDNAQATFKQAQATVQADQAAVESAQINVGYTTIRAPISGRIGRSAVTAGALVTSGQATALTTIQSLDPIYVDVTQSADAALALRHALAAGQLGAAGADHAKVKLLLADNTTYPAEGDLRFSDVTVDQATDSVTLRAVFPNPHEDLLPGMFVREQVNQGVYSNTILAPQQGVTHDPKGAATAMVVGPDGKAQVRQLKTAGVQGDKWIVTDGLKSGDKLIVEGLLKVQPGMAVKASPAKLPTDAASAGSSPSSSAPSSSAQGSGG
jgi:membrane fusion protein (multidrug efflux system)